MIGTAIGLLDAIYLPLHIPNITTCFVGYGLPRVGNMHFADYVDVQRPALSVTRINNRKDIMLIPPGRFLGFRHPSGEVHIDEAGAWLACPGRSSPDSIDCFISVVPVDEALTFLVYWFQGVGQDSTSAKCTVTDVQNIFVGNRTDHEGPYDGVAMGCSS